MKLNNHLFQIYSDPFRGAGGAYESIFKHLCLDIKEESCRYLSQYQAVVDLHGKVDLDTS